MSPDWRRSRPTEFMSVPWLCERWFTRERMRERNRDREKERERKTEREREKERERDGVEREMIY